MKRKLASLVIAIGLVVCNSLSTGVFAATASTDGINQAGCRTCGAVQSIVLRCYKSKYYSWEYTHKKNGQTCTVIVYESPYKGEFCDVCGANQNMPDTDYSRRHPCTERHSSCGLGLVDRPECLADNRYPYPGI